jgi:hypothetical protein
VLDAEVALQAVEREVEKLAELAGARQFGAASADGR